MFRNVLLLTIFVFFFATPLAARQWTVLVYAVTDSFLADCFAADLQEMARVGSSAELEILVQLDKNDYNTRRYRVAKGSVQTVGYVGEVPSGEAKTLVDFVKWGVERAPSERVMLVLYGCVGHLGYGAPSRKSSAELLRKYIGSPLRPMGDSPRVHRDLAKLGRDFKKGRENGARYLGIRHLGFALRDSAKVLGRPIDIVGLDDSCNGCIEKLFEYRQYVNYWISSVGFIPSDDWPYEEVLGLLAAEPTMAEGEFCRHVVDAYSVAYKPYCSLPYGFGATLSAYNLRHTGELTAALKELSVKMAVLCKKRPARLKVLDLREKVLHFINSDILDLKQFVGGLAKLNLPDEDLAHLCGRILELIEETTLAHWADGRHYKPACGTAMTVSQWMGGYDRKKYKLLKWSKYSRWNKVLDLLAKEFVKEVSLSD